LLFQDRVRALFLLSVTNQIQKRFMHPRIDREFRMESRRHRFALPDGDRIVALGSDHFDAGPNPSNLGGADEHHFNRGFAQLPFADRTIDLAAVCISADTDIKRAQSRLMRILYLSG